MHFGIYLNLMLCFYNNFVSFTFGVPTKRRTEEINKSYILRQHKRNFLDENFRRKSCTSLLNECKHEDDCKRAVNLVRSKCTIKARSCNAEMRNLKECGWIMDTLSKHGFNTHHQCLCESKKEACNEVYSTIYQNPCFDSVMYLRKKNLMPEFEPTKSTSPADHELDVSTTDDVIDKLLQWISNNHSKSTFPSSTTISSDKPIVHSETTANTDPANFNKTKIFDAVNLGANKILQDEVQEDTTMLYIIATAIGLCIFLVVAIGAGLICYYRRLLKKENEDVITRIAK